MVTTDEANELAAKWGPAFTSYAHGEKDGIWAAMFADGQPTLPPVKAIL